MVSQRLFKNIAEPSSSGLLGPELSMFLHAVWPSAPWTNATSCCLVFLRMHYIDCCSFRNAAAGVRLTQRLIITPGLASLLWLPITSYRDYKMLLLTYKAAYTHPLISKTRIYAVFFGIIRSLKIASISHKLWLQKLSHAEAGWHQIE